MAHSLSAEQGGPLGSLAQVPVLALLLAGPPLIVVWINGVRWLGSVARRQYRWVLVVAAVAVVAFTAGGGKSYYAAPALAGLFAAGAVQIERFAVPRDRVRLPVVLAVSGLVAALVGLPVLPVSAAGFQHAVNPQPLETYGWPQFVDEVERVEATLPPGTPIFTSNYGEAGALTILGPAAGVHAPVFSGHNNYTYWGPPPGSPATVLCVGEWDARYLHRFWSQVRKVAPITLPGGVRNEESDGATIFVCGQPRGTWAQLWPGLRHFD
jgi:hypothetical protein